MFHNRIRNISAPVAFQAQSKCQVDIFKIAEVMFIETICFKKDVTAEQSRGGAGRKDIPRIPPYR